MKTFLIALLLLTGGHAYASVPTQPQLHAEIQRLDQAHHAKLAQSTSLQQQLAARKQELQNNHERNRRIGILGALFGAPMISVVSLVNMQNNDARVRDLSTRLATAEREHGEILRELARYQHLKIELGYRR